MKLVKQQVHSLEILQSRRKGSIAGDKQRGLNRDLKKVQMYRNLSKKASYQNLPSDDGESQSVVKAQSKSAFKEEWFVSGKLASHKLSVEKAKVLATPQPMPTLAKINIIQPKIEYDFV